MKKIKLSDIVNENVTYKDFELGWMFMKSDGQLKTCYGVLTKIDPDIESSDKSTTIAMEIGKTLKKIAEDHFIKNGYDKFILYGHLDPVYTIEGAKKYFDSHNVKDVNVEEIYKMSVDLGFINV